MTELEIGRFHVDSIAQYKVLKHIAAEFIPEGITDFTGDVADFIYDEKTSAVIIKE